MHRLKKQFKYVFRTINTSATILPAVISTICPVDGSAAVRRQTQLYSNMEFSPVRAPFVEYIHTLIGGEKKIIIYEFIIIILIKSSDIITVCF